MDRDEVIVKLLKCEIYEHIHDIGWWMASIDWSLFKMNRILDRYDEVMRILKEILSETEDRTYLGY